MEDMETFETEQREIGKASAQLARLLVGIHTNPKVMIGAQYITLAALIATVMRRDMKRDPEPISEEDYMDLVMKVFRNHLEVAVEEIKTFIPEPKETRH